jgi:general secretion pathway protein A
MDPPARDNPFASIFDVSHYFVGRHQQEATAHLSYALTEGEGFTVVTGERGVGKTSACRAFVSGLAPAQAAVAYLSGPMHTAGELLLRITRQLGIETAGASTKELIDGLNGFLMQQRVAGRKVMVFIDDAQTLPSEVLEQVRLISNLETTREKLIQIVLVGEPELLELLDSRELRQMGQRVSVRYEIGPLTEAETAVYISQRMGLQSESATHGFTREALEVIFRHTQGNPRLINRVCATALSLARSRKAGAIGRELAAEAAGEFAAEPGRQGRRRFLLAAAAGLVGIMVIVAVVQHARRSVPPDQPIAYAPTVLPLPAMPAPSPAEPLPTDPKPDLPATALQDPLPAPPPPAAPTRLAPPPPPAVLQPARPPVPTRMTHSVQAGAFLYPENARQLVANLTAKGVRAYIFEIRDAQGRTWHTVRVGDFPSRQAAQSHAEEFARREQMKVLVRPFGSF